LASSGSVQVQGAEAEPFAQDSAAARFSQPAPQAEGDWVELMRCSSAPFTVAEICLTNSVFTIGGLVSSMRKVKDTVSASLPELSTASYVTSQSERRSRLMPENFVPGAPSATLLSFTRKKVSLQASAPSWWSCAEQTGSGQVVTVASCTSHVVPAVTGLPSTRFSEIVGGDTSVAAAARPRVAARQAERMVATTSIRKSRQKLAR
jgi:hypothetical protein